MLDLESCRHVCQQQSAHLYTHLPGAAILGNSVTRLANLNKCSVAASQPASGWPQVSTLTTYTSSIPPHTQVLGRLDQHSSHMDSQPASAHNSSVLYIYPPMTPIKPVYSQPLSVTVPVVIGTVGVGWYGRVCSCTATQVLFLNIELWRRPVVCVWRGGWPHYLRGGGRANRGGLLLPTPGWFYSFTHTI